MGIIPMQWPGGVLLWSKGRLMRLLLLLLNLLLLLLIGMMWRNTPQVMSEQETTKVQTSPLQLPASPLRSLSLDHYQEILARPLFWSERRGLQTSPPTEAASSTQPLAFVLIGVVMSPEAKYALLGKPGGTEVTKVQPGDIVEGWMLESMTTNSVSLNRGGERRQITLDEERER